MINTDPNANYAFRYFSKHSSEITWFRFKPNCFNKLLSADTDTLANTPKAMTFTNNADVQQGLVAGAGSVTISGAVDIKLPTKKCYKVRLIQNDLIHQ